MKVMSFVMICLMLFGCESDIEEKQSEWRSLNQTAFAIAEDDQWDVRAYISEEPLAQYLALYENYQFRFTSGPFEAMGVKATIKEISLTSEDGYAIGSLIMTISASIPETELDIPLKFSLRFFEMEEHEAAKSEDAYYSAILTADFFEGETDTFEGNPIGAKLLVAARELVEKHPLEIPLDLPATLSTPIQVDDSDTLEFDDRNDRVIGSISTSTVLDRSILTVPLVYSAPTFTEDGFWVFANSVEEHQDIEEPVDDMPDDDKLEEAIRTLRERLKGHFASLVTPESDFALVFRPQLLGEIVEKMNSLDEAKRTAIISRTDVSGHVIREKLKILIGAEVGVTINAKDLAGALRVENVALTIPEDGAPTLSLEAQAAVLLKGEGAWDSVIGGSTKLTDIELSGTGSLEASGGIRMFKVDDETGSPAAFWGLDMNCATMPISLKGNVDPGFGAGVFSYEFVAATLPTYVFEERGSASALIDGIPKRKDMAIDSPDGTEAIPPAAAIESILRATSARYDGEAFVVEANIAFEHRDSIEFSDEEAKAIEKIRQRNSNTRMPGPSNCPEKGEGRGHIAGLHSEDMKRYVDWLKGNYEPTKLFLDGDFEGSVKAERNRVKAEFERTTKEWKENGPFFPPTTPPGVPEDPVTKEVKKKLKKLLGK